MSFRTPILGLVAILAATAARAAAPDILVADFEAETYGDWAATGTAFGAGPAAGTLPGQMAVSGFQGKRLVNSFAGGDDSAGTLTSPEFKVERAYLTFLIGGGGFQGKTCLNLLVDGRVVRTATGPNTKPGGTEALEPSSWDVADLKGKTARLQVVDRATGSWGHINVDQIVLTDARPPASPVTNPSRELVAERRYLQLPVKNGAKPRRVVVEVDGQPVRQFDIELADAAPDWWAPLDISAWRGKRLTVRADRLPGDSAALRSIDQGDRLKGADDLYRESLRPQFHFSPRRGWTNDPNGLVYYRGEYHLFFQHNPYGRTWGNMHWGHALADDLVHWREVDEALYPDALGPMFSGSAVVDRANTSGFASAKVAEPLVLIYTAAGEPAVQCLAYSDDRSGTTWTKFAGNPVVKNLGPGNRDPKVSWHEPTKRWVMALYVELPGGKQTIHFLTSPDLKAWTVASHIDGFFECPDLFELPVDGGPGRKWVLTAASSEYMVGSFDGRTFTPETSKLPGHRGKGFYAAQTFSDLPPSDGRRIQVGWLQAESPGMPFNQAMSVPLELALRSTSAGPRLTWRPARELGTLRAKSDHSGDFALKPGDHPLPGVGGELLDVRVTFEPGDAAEVGLKVRGVPVIYDARKQEIVVNGHRAPAPLVEGRQSLTILVDRTSIEVFAADGLTYVPMPVIPRAEDRAVSLGATGGTARVVSLDVHELKSAWVRPER